MNHRSRSRNYRSDRSRSRSYRSRTLAIGALEAGEAIEVGVGAGTIGVGKGDILVKLAEAGTVLALRVIGVIGAGARAIGAIGALGAEVGVIGSIGAGAIRDSGAEEEL